jgi:putative transposase
MRWFVGSGPRRQSRRSGRIGGYPGMVIGRAAETGVPGCDERVRDAASAADERPVQGHEILALRHQITVLQRQLSGQRVRFESGDRAFLAALLHQLPTHRLRRMRLLVRPDTVLRWHRDLVARRYAAQSRSKRGGRPRTMYSVRALVLRLASQNPNWGYRRLHGELLVLGVKVAASTVWEILQDAGIPPAPERISSTWADFLRSPADALLACDFFETITLSGARLYVLAVIGHSSRRVRILGATPHPSASWVVQAPRTWSWTSKTPAAGRGS